MKELKLKNPYHDEVRDYIRDQKLIQALKVVREQTGLGLREAKDLVDGVRGGWAKLTLEVEEVYDPILIAPGYVEMGISKQEFNQVLDRLDKIEKAIGLQ